MNTNFSRKILSLTIAMTVLGYANVAAATVVTPTVSQPSVTDDATSVADVDQEVFQLNSTVSQNTSNISSNTTTTTANTAAIATNTTKATSNTSAIATNTTTHTNFVATQAGVDAAQNTASTNNATNIANNAASIAAITGSGVNDVNFTLDSYSVAATGANKIASSDGTHNSFVSTEASEAKIIVNNGTDEHGLIIGTSNTVLSGGTASTTMTLNDNGVQLKDENNAAVIVTGIANGVANNDAVNAGQLNSTRSSLQSGINSNSTRINSNSVRITTNSNQISNNASGISLLNADLASYKINIAGALKDIRETAYSGIAASIALSGAQMPSEAGKTAVSFGMGHYEGENAIGFNVVHALEAFESKRATVSFGVARSQGNTAARISTGFEF